MNAGIGLDVSLRRLPVQAVGLLVPLSAALFYLDLHAPDRMSFGLPYLLVVILAQSVGGGQAATLAAAASAVLIVLAPLLTSAPDTVLSGWTGLLGRGAVIAAAAMMVLFLRQRDAARETLRERVDTLDTSATRRHDELRLVNVQLHREIAERRRAEVRSGYLASIVESSADAIIGLSLDGTILSWNDGATRVYGHSRADILSKPSSQLLPPEHEAELTDLLTRVAGGEHVGEVEALRLRCDGTEFDVAASFSPILDDRGAIIGVSMIERDITRRVQAEQAIQSLNAELEAKVKQRTDELQQAVGELEAFSYSVSHDLRAPLRALHGFAESLSQDAADHLDESEQSLLGRIQRAAGRMDQIIEDLLMLSRAGNHRIEKEVVNLGEIARTVIEDLGAAAPERKVEWEIGDGALAWGDPGLLRLVVQNLLGNAFKYSAHTESAHISFGVEQRDSDMVTYFVRDDGTGFDPEMSDKLFRPFSRLHASDEFEGSGIGLATVERIVRRHGGSVSAEGRKGEGAVFRFQLPLPKRSRTGEDVFAPSGATATA